MGKKVRVKRYSSIYSQRRERRRKFLRIGSMVIIFMVIVALSFLVTASILGHRNDQRILEMTSNSSAESTSSGQQSYANMNPSVPMEKIKALQIPWTTMQSDTKTETFLEKAKEDGYNTILVPLKNRNGEVLYQSNVPEVSEYDAQISNAVDAAVLKQKIEEAGLMPMGQIYAFEDTTAPSLASDNTYLKNKTKIYTDANGDSWLNPYKESARKYICDLVKETKDLGYQTVLIDGCQFPGSLSGIITDAKGQTQQEILEEFYQQVKSVNASCVFSYYWDTVTGGTSQKFYGGDPTSYQNLAAVAPIIQTGAYKNGVKDGNVTVKGADKMTAYLLDEIQQNVSEQTVIIPEIPSNQNQKLVLQGIEDAHLSAYMVFTEK